MSDTHIQLQKPYLIIPKLIEQSTWGGTYIRDMKSWSSVKFLQNIKIGQSYELFSGTKLMLQVNDSDDTQFLPELGYPDKPDTMVDHFPLKKDSDYITLNDFIKINPEAVLGKKVCDAYGFMPLLIKINQSSGNSFQLHLRNGETHERWRPKPESWYYLEEGKLTFGVNPGKNISDYKTCCLAIESYMKTLSADVKSGKTNLADARNNATKFVKEANPWQYINTHTAKKYTIIDLSHGGIHHSWEENEDPNSPGNVIYEVQLDVMDPECTIRSFDQGKLKDSGDIREIHINDYFTCIDTEPAHNDIKNATFEKNGNTLLRTPIYNVDIFELNQDVSDTTGDTFVHLFVRDGSVEVKTNGGAVRLTRGHSCFMPKEVGAYNIHPTKPDAVVLKTFM
jgi:mannose-6-phosphate isomerase class I